MDCLMCHGTNSKLTLTFPSKETLALAVPEDQWHSSVHGSVLVCQDCHQGYDQVPHTQVAANSYREYSLAKYELCKRCHFANYTKSLDSVHYQLLTNGHTEAPVCTDCHGAHNVQRPDQPKTLIPQTCSKCHADIYDTYLDSVHGKALVDLQNQDVPTCTYCHGVHNIKDPRTTNYRLDIPQLCGSCHADKDLMAKYGLSSNVLSTYLNDFHGTTVSLVGENRSSVATSYEAVCTDCHGIHNIVSAKDPSSPVIKANLVSTCQQCHTGASENFPSAWLSHYEPSIQHAPMVFLVKLFYRIFIPFLVVGLAIQVVLNLWRSAINR